MLNSDLLHRIADKIEAEPEHYRQSQWCSAIFSLGDDGSATVCGTAYCVAGWAVALERPDLLKANGRFDASDELIEETAKELLGVNFPESYYLFGGAAGPKLGHTPAEALHKMAEMGEIDPDVWSHNPGKEVVA